MVYNLKINIYSIFVLSSESLGDISEIRVVQSFSGCDSFSRVNLEHFLKIKMLHLINLILILPYFLPLKREVLLYIAGKYVFFSTNLPTRKDLEILLHLGFHASGKFYSISRHHCYQQTKCSDRSVQQECTHTTKYRSHYCTSLILTGHLELCTIT